MEKITYTQKRQQAINEHDKACRALVDLVHGCVQSAFLDGCKGMQTALRATRRSDWWSVREWIAPIAEDADASHLWLRNVPLAVAEAMTKHSSSHLDGLDELALKTATIRAKRDELSSLIPSHPSVILYDLERCVFVRAFEERRRKTFTEYEIFTNSPVYEKGERVRITRSGRQRWESVRMVIPFEKK